MPDLPQRHTKPKAKGVTKHEVEEKAWGNGRGGRPWRRKRERILKRDGYMCQCAECKGMKRVATEVDHIIPLSQGGTDDDSNLMAIAGYPCHARRRQGSRRHLGNSRVQSARGRDDSRYLRITAVVFTGFVRFYLKIELNEKNSHL